MTALIIGLGNPGEEFVNTRHNSGFIVVDALAEKLIFRRNVSRRTGRRLAMTMKADWRLDTKLFSEVAETGAKKNHLVLAKPQTMMNGSGKAAAALVKKYKVKPVNVVVIHDDIDIPLGHHKLSFGKHSAGHKGVESVMRALKTKDFWRFRIGIHPPKTRKKVDAMRIILGKFKPAEVKTLRAAIKDALTEKLRAFAPTLNSTE